MNVRDVIAQTQEYTKLFCSVALPMRFGVMSTTRNIWLMSNDAMPSHPHLESVQPVENEAKLEISSFLGKPVPEWQCQFIESYEKLAKKCKADEEVRLVDHPRGRYRMWAIVKKRSSDGG